jgi:nucleotide-binding universal stress UspA family protein
MQSIKKILFPVDLSDVSPRLAPWVVTLVKTFMAELHLLFVARTLEHFSSMYVAPSVIQSFQSEVIRGAETKIEEFARSWFSDCPSCTTKVVLGDASEEILAYAASQKIDLIVLGTHGRKGMERVLFGSVAERVIKSAAVPVMSINPYRVADR